jgi:hypothetical protein
MEEEMRNGKRWILAVILILGFLGGACDNAFESLGDKDSREAKLEEARIAMDSGDFTTAVALLVALNSEYPGDTEISRSLASAYSGKAGLSFFDLATQAQEAQDSGSSVDNTIGQLVSAFPHPVTDNNISDISTAITMLESISLASGDPNDYFALGLYYSAKAILLILKDTDRLGNDGIPDTFTPLALSDADSQTVYGSIGSAILNFGKAGLDDSSEILKSLNDLKGEIDARPETGIGNKLRAYLDSVF